MKKYISPSSYYVQLHGKSALLNMSIDIDPDENVDDDDKTSRQNYSIWDQADMDY